jgi:hypothetical protein
VLQQVEVVFWRRKLLHGSFKFTQNKALLATAFWLLDQAWELEPRGTFVLLLDASPGSEIHHFILD